MSIFSEYARSWWALFCVCLLASGIASATETNDSLTNRGIHRDSDNTVYADGRRLVIGEALLPDTSFYVPNSFPNSSGKRFYGFLHGISRVRKSNLNSGCEPDCSDAILYFESDIWKSPNQSFTGQLSLHSLTGRNGGTTIGEGLSLGFKYAKHLSSSSAFSISGEHVVQLDRTVDLGRNLFVGYSKSFTDGLLNRDGASYLLNVGLGTGLYTVYGNEILDTGEVFGGNNISGDFDKLTWGLIGSLAYYYSETLSFGAEFIGYGFGIGASWRPFKRYPMTFAGYLYDVVDDFPSGIPCAESPCQPRLYGRVTFSH